MRQGLLAAAGAYLLWGLFPIYWKLLHHVPALQIMAHRIVWCAIFVAAWLSLRSGWSWLRTLSPKLIGMLTASALLVSVNWWLYIWAVNAGFIVETSLGYFINPLVSVLLGVVVLRERLNRAQWAAVAIAAAGVLWLTLQAGHPPWIALALALSFGGYGLIRKLAVVPAVQGLMVESGLLLAPALAILLWQETHGGGGFGHIDTRTDALLILGGLVTALPLILFAIGARRIPLSMVGILQYLAPTLQLLCGIWLFHEPFSSTQAIGFGCIWAALGLYAADGLLRSRRRPSAALQQHG
jgi:chloramphenicol-sensitive protein RarD